MVSMTYEKIIEACNGIVIEKGNKTDVDSISIDTRVDCHGKLFIPIIGEQFDGHSFIMEAYKKGASGVIFQKGKEEYVKDVEGIYVIQVEDTLEALMNISGCYRKLFPNVISIGVTGSTGKTTTKDMISCVLSKGYDVLYNMGNLNNQIGLPLTIFNLENKHEIAVLEMGMSSFNEIRSLAKIVKPNIGVITNIGMSHIEHLGSKENIMMAKLEITQFMTKDDILLVNGDDEYLRKLKATATDYGKVFFGLSDENDIYPVLLEENDNGGYSFATNLDESYRYSINQPGLHNVNNALVAIWLASHFKIKPVTIQKAFDGFKPTGMRMEIINSKGYNIINDTYNANPDSMKAALAVLNNMKGRKVAILGNMLEMGKFSEEGHASVGRYLSTTNIDCLVTVGNMATFISKEAKVNKNIRIITYNNNKEVIDNIDSILQKDDTVLVKGSRGMKMEEIVYYLQERS